MVAQGEILSGRYLLREELGAGGMGVVYKAVDLRTGAEVAVKVPHAHLAGDREYVERLRREAQIAAQVHSPRIALVTDFADHEGVPYLVMEYVPGENLADRIARLAPLSPNESLHIALEVARALDAAHQHGITHRDLKPQNIHIDDGDVKVLDFGIARVEGQAQLTGAGLVIGSPEYLAPERAEGRGDIRADIYALGVMLYEMLTGRLPYTGTMPVEVVHRHRTEPIPALPPEIPAPITEIVERCLAKRPDERYQTPRDLVVALQGALRTLDQYSRTVRVPRHTPAEGIPPVPGGAMTGEGFAPPPPPFAPPDGVRAPAGTGDVYPAALPEREGTTGEVPPRRPTTDRGVPATVAWTGPPAGAGAPTGGAAPPQPHLASGPQARTTATGPNALPAAPVGMGTGASGPSGPGAVVPPPALGRSRRAPWSLVAGGVGLVLLLAVGGFAALSRSGGNDGAPVAAEATATPGRSGVATAGPAGAARTPAPQPPGGAPSVAFLFPAEGSEVTSPVRLGVQVGGVTLKAAAEGDPNGRHLHYFLDTDPAAVLGPGQPVPTGQQNIIHTEKTEQIVDLPPGQHTVWVVLTDNAHVPFTPSVQAKVTFTVTGIPAPSGEQAPVVYQSLQGGRWQIFAVDGTGRNPRRLTSGTAQDLEPSWAPDRSRIVFASDRDGRYHLYTMTADGRDVQQITRGDWNDRTPVWSPDGSSIAFVSDREGGVPQIYTMPAGGGEARRVTSGSAPVVARPSWSPDGRQLAYAREADGVSQIAIIDAAGGEPRQITSARRRHIDPAWSPDGRKIAFSAVVDNRWNIFVMDPDGGNQQKITNGDPQDRQPAWSPDGRQLTFASGRDGQMQLYALPLDSSQARPLTEGLAHNAYPSWPRR